MTSETSDGDVTMNMKTNDGYENNKCWIMGDRLGS